MSVMYWALNFRLPAELEDVFTAELWSCGGMGCEIRPETPGWLAVNAYFPAAETSALDLAAWQARGVELVLRQQLGERDWLADYRQRAHPLRVGCFWLDPRDLDAGSPGEVPADVIPLRIPAQTAFGTGSHESTQLALLWLAELPLAGRDILDVGTGSAILSLAALALGARRVWALDVDAQAVVIAHANSCRNGLFPHLFAGKLQALKPNPKFDLVLANVLPERILPDFPALLPLLKPGGRVVSSGNLQTRRDELLLQFAQLGFLLVGEKSVGEWTSFILQPGDATA